MFFSILRVTISVMTVILIGVLLFTPKAPVRAHPTLEEVIFEHIEWISLHSGYDANVLLPRIVFVTRQELQIISRGHYQYLHDLILKRWGIDHGISRTLGGYGNFTIYIQRHYALDDYWRERYPSKPFYMRPRWSSIFVHELVHYLQDLNGIIVPGCPTFEIEAYSLHSVWIRKNDHDLPRPDVMYQFFANPCT